MGDFITLSIIKFTSYYIDYSVNNKRYREKVGSSKSQAESALAKRQTQIIEGKFFDIRREEEKIRFEDFAQEYLNKHSKQHKKSWITDSYHIVDFNMFFKNKCLSEITAQDIENFKMERQKEVSKSSVNRQMGLLRGMFNKAVDWGKLQNNPMKSVQFFSEPEGRLRFLEKEEINKLISNCDNRLRPIVVLAIYTGMRKGEIFNLQWQDIDFKRNIIILLETKNGKSRKIPMSPPVKSTLNDMVRRPESPYVFCYDNGKRILDVRKSFSTALRKSGITNFTFHDMRHTFSSQLVMSGVNLNCVRELLGHSDITMTLRYSHLAPSHKQQAVDMLAESIDTRLTQEQPIENLDISQVFNNVLVTNNLGS